MAVTRGSIEPKRGEEFLVQVAGAQEYYWQNEEDAVCAAEAAWRAGSDGEHG